MTIFASDSNAQTFDYEVSRDPWNLVALLSYALVHAQAGDIGYVPATYGEHISQY